MAYRHTAELIIYGTWSFSSDVVDFHFLWIEKIKKKETKWNNKFNSSDSILIFVTYFFFLFLLVLQFTIQLLFHNDCNVFFFLLCSALLCTYRCGDQWRYNFIIIFIYFTIIFLSVSHIDFVFCHSLSLFISICTHRIYILSFALVVILI